MLVAVIDIGSTSVRLMLTDGQMVEKQINTTRLAEGMSDSFMLNPLSMERTSQAVAEYYFLAVSYGAEKIFCYATEAVRSAKNANEFVNKINKLCGLDVDILKKEDEAKIGFFGAYDSGNCCVIDMGGASTEITIGNNKGITYSHSLPYGIVRLSDREKTGVDLVEYINNKLVEYSGMPSFDHIVAIGGTITTISAMLNKLDVYDSNVVNGHIITKNDIHAIYNKVKPMPYFERIKIPGLSKNRADIITSGMLMYELLLNYLGFDSLTVSEGDGTEGYLILKNILQKGFKATYGKITQN